MIKTKSPESLVRGFSFMTKAHDCRAWWKVGKNVAGGGLTLFAGSESPAYFYNYCGILNPCRTMKSR